MATVLEPTPAVSKVDTRVEAELRRAANSIRTTDVLTGMATLAVLLFGYAVAAMLIDRWLVLPDWARQVGLVGFVILVLSFGSRLILMPLRAVVNPRFAARRVERTVEGGTNAVINWVDLRDRDLPASVRNAIGTEAAGELADADVNKAVDQRPLVWTGAVAALLLVTLAVLFVVCKPPQFFSLLGRAFNPFTAISIAGRTQIEMIEPKSGDATITTGDAFTVAVEIAGYVPDAEDADHVRLQYRHNPAAEFESIPLREGATHREWNVRVPDYIVQNGFSYRVVAGDAATPEYRVTVRTRPQFTAYEARYEYPDYLRMKPEIGSEPRLEAYRGTKVTLTATANRELRTGKLYFSDRLDATTGDVVGDDKRSVRFTFPLEQSGTYRLSFTPTADEPGTTSPVFPIKVLDDRTPIPTIEQPADEEITLPANGMLAINGVVTDDFGIDTVTLRFRLVGENIRIRPKPYLNGTNPSFRRDSDGTFPTLLEYKGSVKLDGLKSDKDEPVELKEGMVLEYWLEATDNCTVPAANIGTSLPKRVKIAAPIVEPEKQAADDQAVDRRIAEEKQHGQRQQQKLNTEQRQPPQPLHEGEGEEQARPPEGEPGPAQPQEGNAQPDDGSKPPQDAAKPESGDPQSGDPQNGKPESGQPNDAASKDPMSGGASKAGPPGAEGTPDSKTPPSDAQSTEEDDLKRKAEQVENALQNEQRQPGDSRDNRGAQSSETDMPPAEPKAGGTPDPSEASEPKSGEPKMGEPDPMAKPGEPAAAEKDAGKPQTPPEPSESKASPDSNQQVGPKATEGQPTGDTPKPEPKEQEAAGQEKTTKPEPQSEPGMGRSSEGSQASDPMTGAKTAESKPNEARDPGEERPSESPEKGTNDSTQSAQRPEAGRGKSDRPTDPAKPKSSPEEPAAGTEPDQSQAKAGPQEDQPPGSEQSAGGGKPGKPMGGGQPGSEDMAREPGQEKPSELDREPGELDREIGRGGQPSNGPEDVERLTRDSKKLDSDNAAERKQTEEKFDDLLGKKNREELQRNVRQSKSDNPAERKQAEENIDQLAKKAAKNEQQADELKKKANDLAANDPQKREAAEKEFDQALGKQGREDLQKSVKQQQSGTPGEQQAAKEKIDELSKQAARNQSAEQAKKDAAELAKQAGDLASNDEAKRKAAEQKFDEKIGEQNRKDLQQAMQDLQSGDPKKQEAAKDKLQQMADKAKQQAADRQQAEKDAADLAKQAGDLASKDEGQRKAAEEKFDKALGEENRKDLQQAMQDLQSGDPKKQEAAKDKLEEMAGNAQKQMAKQQQVEKDAADLAKQAGDLASNDEAKRNAAEEKFDKAIGEQNRKDLQQAMKDLQSGDPKKQQAAKDKLEQIASEAQKQEQARRAEDARKQAEKMADQAGDLASDDSEKRKAAEEAFDKQVGEEKRKELQQAMEDLKSGDQERQQAAMDKLQKMAQEAQQQANNQPGSEDSETRGDDIRPGGAGGRGMEEKLLDDDPKNRLKTAELQLDQFEKNRYNKELQKKLGYSQEEFDRFLDSYRDMVNRQRDQVEAAAKSEEPTRTGPITRTVGGSEKVEPRGTPAAGPLGGIGPGAAPPGFSDASRRFAEEAARMRRNSTNRE